MITRRQTITAALAAAITVPDTGTSSVELQLAMNTDGKAALEALCEHLVGEVRLLCSTRHHVAAASLVDAWTLSRAFEEYHVADVGGSNCGLVHSLELALNRDNRFVAVPAGLREEVVDFVERRKAGLAEA